MKLMTAWSVTIANYWMIISGRSHMSKITIHSSLALVIANRSDDARLCDQAGSRCATEIPQCLQYCLYQQEGELWVEEGVLHIRAESAICRDFRKRNITPGQGKLWNAISILRPLWHLSRHP